MPFIRELADREATGPARQLFDEDVAKDGYVWNLTRVLAQRPDVLAAWRGLNGAIRGNMDLRRFELVTLAASARAFFTKVLDGLGVQPDAAYEKLELALRQALTIGRPIAVSPGT